MAADIEPSPDLPVVPYGAWPSPIDARDLVTGASQPIDTWAEGGTTWWSQVRPDQGGRQQILRRDADGSVHDVLPESWNSRTRVHEYGGAAWWVHDGVLFTVDWSDQRLYRVEPGRPPVPITPAPSLPAALRYADGRLTSDGALCICVRESHLDSGDVVNEIVAIEAVPPGEGEPAEPVVLRSGPDFVMAPRINQDDDLLAWIEWNHPNMPWDTTQLWVGQLVRDEGGVDLWHPHLVLGEQGESLIQPEWGPDGSLYLVSDRSQWWNVFSFGPGAPARLEELLPVTLFNAEVGRPAWVLGQSRYLVGDDVWMTCSAAGGAALIQVNQDHEVQEYLGLPFLSLDSLRLDEDAEGVRIVAIASRATAHPAVVELRPEGKTIRYTILNDPPESGLPEAAISTPRRISFPSANGRMAFGLLFLPVSAEAVGPAQEKPPLLVTIHGGPTSAASPAFSLATQYWTTRGFAVVAVDYGGSTGYGRDFRRLLDDSFGVVDVEDACAAATWLAEQGLVDQARLAIRGGSAGGFTTLVALATKDVFAAGASHFGVADLAALARDTHKFESRYLDGLVGEWPQDADIYEARSPLSHIEGFDRPLIVFQGDEDPVVPPAQAEAIVKALAAKEVPHAYLLFAGEQHGFRKAENIIRSMEAELSFYAQVFGFTPAGEIDPVQINFANRIP